MSRQTRNSCTTPDPNRKRPKDMDVEEYRAYRTEQKRKERMSMSRQKKLALKMKRREKRREEKEEKVAQLHAAGPQPGTSSESDRLRQSVYNLNHSYKKKAKRLGMSHEEYAKATLNHLNPRTPEKKTAIMQEQRNHPCKALFINNEIFEEDKDMEGELGIITTDAPKYGPHQEEEVAKPTHHKIKLFYCQDEISRILPHSCYSTKHGPARTMLLTLKQAYSMFCQEEGKIVGLTTFQDLRPRNVRLLGSVPLDSCLCVYCTNVRLKIVTINCLLGASGQNPPEKEMLAHWEVAKY